MPYDESMYEHQLASLGFGFLEQAHIGIIVQLSAVDDGQTNDIRYYANKAAQALLDLPSAILDRVQLASIPFTIDPGLVASTDVKHPLHAPIPYALSHPNQEQRNLVLHARAICLEGQTIQVNNQTYSSVLIFERDHRLFVQQRHVTDLLTSEISLKDMIAFDKLISSLSTTLINVDMQDAKHEIQGALAALGEFTQADRTYIFQFSSDFSEMSNTYEWVREGVTSHRDELQNVPREALPWFSQVLETEGLFVIHDVRTIPPEGQAERSEFDKENICSVLCVGIYNHQKLVGMVGCDMVARRRRWTEADIRRLKLVGEVITNALQREHYIHSLEEAQLELTKANEALKRLAQIDGLTGLANRRHFNDTLQKELSRAVRHKTPLCLALLDIDYFKAYNDSYGHLAGDAALKRVANILSDQFRRSGEMVARFGGEEFVVIIPGMPLAEARQQVQHALDTLYETAVVHAESPFNQRLTLSAGLTGCTEAQQLTADALITQADQALYEAKAKGRNLLSVKKYIE
ncbi:sensor domain-containing diguanylate cyclase [Aliidiomarina taiwanensis]|uniref:diguanylate cyclase n=1 Tax=Aliidiomarina taiwanensis TaxID=946228 RepID=A0A432X8V2_9GAMM|nr:sensor domain-containing diguanylate cyclase [Aliidiomarina taiwanensis]RUO43833.1 sensor domain-containing diguanylate cyclase [Aliidiomarina taiwanensis]